MNTVTRWGINADDFITPLGRGMFLHLSAYFSMPATAGAVLGPHAIQAQYPTFQLVHDLSMTTEALCVEVRRGRTKAEMKQLMKQTEEMLDVDPVGALNKLSTGMDFLRRLGMSKQTDVYADDAMARVLQTYELKKKGVNMSICPWPWEPLQEATGGIEKDDYVIIYGRPKSMKSWVLAALISWAIHNDKNVLIYTKEMTADNIYMRICAIIAGVRYKEFRGGKLDPIEERQVYDVWRTLRAMRVKQRIVCLSGKDTGDGGDTVPWLRSKIEEHKPDLCFIDGMYLMADARGSAKQKDNFRVQNISRDLRQVILDTGVPIVATIQANRDAAKNKEANMDEIAFSDAIGQDATIAMRVINEKNAPTLALLLAGSREFALDGFRIYGIPATNFGDAGPLTAGEAIDAQRTDVESIEQTGSGVKKRKKKEDTTAQVDAAAEEEKRLQDSIKNLMPSLTF